MNIEIILNMMEQAQIHPPPSSGNKELKNKQTELINKKSR
jgi:hypothetical protein